MKVLVISNLFPSDKDPYFGTFVKNFVDDLSARKSVDILDLCVVKGRSYFLYTKILKYISFYFQISYKLLFFRYDLVYVHIITHAAVPLRFISLFKEIPLVFNIHGEDLLVQTRLANFFLHLITPLLLKSRLIVIPSIFFKQKVRTLLPQLSASKLFVSASGGVHDFFFSESCSKQSEEFAVGYVSRIDRGKGWDVFLKALKLLNDKNVCVKAYIVGSGEEVAKMKQLILDLALENVTYLGPITYKDLPSVYSGFDLFVFPTLLEESLGLVGLEAMACRCPVLGSNIGGLTDYIKDGINGYFFIPGNELDLAEKICQYKHLSTDEKRIMKEYAYQTALGFKSDAVSDRLFRKLNL